MLSEPDRQLLLTATRQERVDDAVRDLAEGLFVSERISRPQLLQAVIELAEDSEGKTAALGRLARKAAASDLNTAADPDLVEPGSSGWEAIEQLRTDGVAYEVPLAQRTEGGSWRSHRDRTGGRSAHVLAAQLCPHLDEAGVDYLRTANSDGDTPRARITELLGAGRDPAGLVGSNPTASAPQPSRGGDRVTGPHPARLVFDP